MPLIDRAPVLGLVGSAAGGLDEILPKLAQPMIERGWRVAVTLTPTAATWLDSTDDLEKIEQVTGFAGAGEAAATR